MKKLLLILLSVLMMIALTACGSEAANDEAKAEPADTAAKTLVVYFSATGNTADVADSIAAAAGADTFEIVPAEPYTDDDLNYRDENSRVVREHENPDQRDLALATATPDNWEQYDTVFIGYPIWWGIAAWPVDSFVQANDFGDKTVIPFCTSSDSGLGESGTLLRDMANGGNWQEGMRFAFGTSADEVQAWVSSLNLPQ